MLDNYSSKLSTFHHDAFLLALAKIGYQAEEIRAYKELILSEINYLNHFLYFLNDDDINQLLIVYDQKKFHAVDGEMTQEQLRYIYNSLKQLRHDQHLLLEAFYHPDPLYWQNSLIALCDNYIHFISLNHNIPIPLQIDEKFKKIEEVKVEKGHPRVGTLGAIFIAPVQRIPRYSLLAKEMMKCQSHHPSSQEFQQRMVSFADSVGTIGRKLNDAILKLDQEKARQVIKGLSIPPKKQLSVAVSLLSDLQVLDYQEVKRVLDHFDFKACEDEDNAMLSKALAVDTNKKYTAYFENKIILDKVIWAIKSAIELKKSPDADLQVFVAILQCLNNQRAKSEQCNMMQAFADAYQMCSNLRLALDEYIHIIADSLLDNVNNIFKERQLPLFSVDQIKAFIVQSEEPSSPYIVRLKSKMV